MFHVFSLVCFLIYGVKSKSGHDRSQSFGSTLHVLGSKTEFLTKFLDDSAWLLLEKLKKHVILTKNKIFDEKSKQYLNNLKNT